MGPWALWSLGNEKADRLAIRGAKGVRARRCGMGLSGSYLEERLEEWLGKMTALRWQEEKGMRQAKLLIGEQPNKTWLAEVRKLERRRLRVILQGALKGLRQKTCGINVREVMPQASAMQE